MMKRIFFFLISLPLLVWGNIGVEQLIQKVYNLYRTNVIQPDGRVIDWQNKAVTHSEGIGYSLFFAVKMSDKETFYKIYHWFKRNIPLNDKGLVPWLWGKNSTGNWKILDFNDATDGNLWIAYALLLGYEKWKNKEFKEFAINLIKNIKKYDIFLHKNCVFLLPASEFFIGSKSLTINPSYYAPFIFAKFYEYDKDPIWLELINQSFKIWYFISVTPYHLFPEWIDIDLKTCKVTKVYGIMGFNSIRIPIWILYSADLDSHLKDYLTKKMFNLSQKLKNNGKLFCKLSTLNVKNCKDFLYAAFMGYEPSYIEDIDFEKYKYNYYFLALTLFNLIFLNF